MCTVVLALKGVLLHSLWSQGRPWRLCHAGEPYHWRNSYCRGYMAVRMCKVLAIPRSWYCVLQFIVLVKANGILQLPDSCYTNLRLALLESNSCDWCSNCQWSVFRNFILQTDLSRNFTLFWNKRLWRILKTFSQETALILNKST